MIVEIYFYRCCLMALGDHNVIMFTISVVTCLRVTSILYNNNQAELLGIVNSTLLKRRQNF